MRNKLIFIGILIVACSIFGGLILPMTLRSNDKFSGKEVFNSQQDYTTFKQSLVTYKAYWDVEFSGSGTYVQALSSDPPIIVQFSVGVKKNTAFPYGDRTKEYITNTIFAAVIFLCIVCLLYLISWVWVDGDFWYLFENWRVKKDEKD